MGKDVYPEQEVVDGEINPGALARRSYSEGWKRGEMEPPPGYSHLG